MKIYHADWSPCGNIAFAAGRTARFWGRFPRSWRKAKGVEIAVADAEAVNRWMQITFDGNCNKEPD